MLNQPGVVLPFVGLLAAACVASEPSESASSSSTRGSTQEEPVFAFLLERYDRNRDGVVSREEYDRPGGSFARLDRTGDGALTALDFAPAGRRVRGLAFEEGTRLRAVHLLAWYFQADSDVLQLGEDELVSAFGAFDADSDGRVGRTEFERVAAQRRELGIEPAGRLAGLLEVETTDPWERILNGVDRDDDGFLTSPELVEFFHANATEDPWSFDPDTRAGSSGSWVGQVAPDFQLRSPEGDRSTTLSEFTGQRPVALIFGSYS